MPYNLYILDTETTGNTPTDRIVQIAYKKKGDDTIVSEFFKPSVPISVESMEVTHITPDMVEKKPAFEGSDLWKKTKDIFANEKNILIAHNALFDIGMLKNDGIEVAAYIDTMKLTRFLDEEEEIPSVRLQYLRYFWNLPVQLPGGVFPHDAQADVIVCEQLFNKIQKDIAEMTGKKDDELIEHMIEISKRPRLIKKFMFGKYKAEKIDDVAKKDFGYLQWLYEQKKLTPETEGDWIYTLEQYLKPAKTLF